MNMLITTMIFSIKNLNLKPLPFPICVKLLKQNNIQQKMNNFELLKFIKNFDNLDNYLQYILKNNEKIKIGHIYEWISNICILFGVSKYGKNIQMYSGDAERLTKSNFNMDILTINEGSKEGIADIKFKKDNFLYCFSVKYYQTDGNKNYDIDIIQNRYFHNNLKIDIKVGLICKNREIVLKKFSKVHNKDNKKEIFNIGDNLFGINDISKWYRNLKQLLQTLNYSKDNIYDYLNQDKTFIRPHLHQYVACEKIQKMFENGKQHVLLNAICRCGKTFIAGHLVSKYNYKRVLLITPRPTSTKESYEIMLNNFRNFKNYCKGIKSYENTKDEIVLDKNIEYNFTVISRQLLADRHKDIDYSYFDLVILDETQKMCSTNMKNEIYKMKKNDVKILNMTATSNNVEQIMNISENNIIRYGLNNILDYQNGELYSFGDREIVDYYLKNIQTSEEIINYYKNLPKLKMYYTHLDLEDKFYDEERGVTFKKLFKSNKLGTTFLHHQSIKSLFRQLLGDPDKDDKFILKMVEDEANNETILNNITLVFLPFGQGIPIKQTTDNLLNLLRKFEDFKEDYYFHSFCSNDDYQSDKIVKEINDLRLKYSHKKIIIFVGGMLEVGCSIPYADNVIMMNDSMNLDSYIQRIYRCLTENGKLKKQGNVIDFNPHNVLRGSMEILKSSGKSDNEKIELILKERMVRILNGDLQIEEMSSECIHDLYRSVQSIDIFREELYELKDDIKLLSQSVIMKNMKSEIQQHFRDKLEMEKENNIQPSSYNKIFKEKTKEQIKEFEESRFTEIMP